MHDIEIKYHRDLRMQVKHCKSGEIIITDAPIDNQGKGESFSPTDLLVASLGSCILTIISIVSKRKSINLFGTKMFLKKIMTEKPRMISKIYIDIYFNCFLEEKDKRIFEKAAYTCPVYYSLNEKIDKQIKFHYLNDK